jgi:hypothetical protein
MTTQYLSDWDELAEAQRARQSAQARLTAAPTVGALASGAADQGRWLTAILRPAGTMDRAALRGLSESLGHLASSSNMIIVDLTAAVVCKPGAFARDLLAPARAFERDAVPVVTLAADSMPPQAA